MPGHSHLPNGKSKIVSYIREDCIKIKEREIFSLMIHSSKSNLKSGFCYRDHRSGEHTRIIPVIYEGHINNL